MLAKSIVNTREYFKLVQQSLNELSWDRINRTALVVDGIFGARSVQLLRDYQSVIGVPVTGRIEGLVQDILEDHIDRRYITRDYIAQEARTRQIEPAMVFALMRKESMTSGFLHTGQPRILFERHKFYHYLSERKTDRELQMLSLANSDILSRSAGGYKGGVAEWERLNRAALIDAQCALVSASWGLGQVMGFNWNVVGASDIWDLVKRSCESERYQLEFLLAFITNQSTLYRAFKDKNWTTIARLYNGAAYAKNNYDTDLKRFYQEEEVQYKRI